MKHHTMVLDCTLRDGAYLIDKKFGNNNINGIIEGLLKAGIDCIEIGFFQDGEYGEGKTVFKNSIDAKRFIPSDKKNTIFTVLADCSRYSINNLDRCDGTSIDAIRECFFKNEQKEAVDNCKVIIEKGYKCFVQPVDILGYSDEELISLIKEVNKIDPYCFSIVDTFGSMYIDDLHRVYQIIDSNLVKSCKIGFHSHNNMQMSSALSQEFINMTKGVRTVIVDSTISGMGRGAGNTPTELLVQYLVSQRGYSYDIDAILDIIDDYMSNIRTMCSWGYSTPYFIAGSFGAHVNNVTYLTQKNSIRSSDIRAILEKIGAESRKRYDYELLEEIYLDNLQNAVDDREALKNVKDILDEKDVLILVPGYSIISQRDKIERYIDKVSPVVISINFVPDDIYCDFLYISNTSRYAYWKNDSRFRKIRKLIASNIKSEAEDETEIVISVNKLVKCGFELSDNSTIMALHLLDLMNLKSIAFAGFDGYDSNSDKAKNYAIADMETVNVRDNPERLNDEISKMLMDYKATRKHRCRISFVTKSRFEILLVGEERRKK